MIDLDPVQNISIVDAGIASEPAQSRPAPLRFDPVRVVVEALESNGHRITADIRVQPDAETSIRFRGVRLFPSGGTYKLVSPGARREDGSFVSAVVWPKTWIPPIVEAILRGAGR